MRCVGLRPCSTYTLNNGDLILRIYIIYQDPITTSDCTHVHVRYGMVHSATIIHDPQVTHMLNIGPVVQVILINSSRQCV